jgi:hypothetical protein
MPVRTGFLRNSGKAAKEGMPSGERRAARGGQRGKKTAFDRQARPQIALLIANTMPGEKIYFGWTAAYARRMEYRYHFMRSAAQNWQKIVNAAARRAKQEIP